tara:strand:- start:34 stop:996 length:963 start_codon:yes stop_codon:yes gene_type:complete
MPKVKPLARQSSPLGTLLYIQKGVEDKSEQDTYNVIRDHSNMSDVAQEYLNNESKNGTRKYYHEIIAFDPRDHKKCTPDLLKTFADSYIQTFYNDNKVYWGVHRDKDHPHIHLCISATKLDGTKLHFSGSQLGIQDAFVQDFSKKNNLSYLDRLEIGKNKKTNPTQPETEMKKNRAVTPDKECVSTILRQAFDDPSVTDKESFKDFLSTHDIKLSKRQTGLVFNNRTYRFKTLGFDKDFYKNDLFLSVHDLPIKPKNTKPNKPDNDLKQVTKETGHVINTIQKQDATNHDDSVLDELIKKSKGKRLRKPFKPPLPEDSDD